LAGGFGTVELHLETMQCSNEHIVSYSSEDGHQSFGMDVSVGTGRPKNLCWASYDCASDGKDALQQWYTIKEYFNTFRIECKSRYAGEFVFVIPTGMTEALLHEMPPSVEYLASIAGPGKGEEENDNKKGVPKKADREAKAANA
jgi:hypothetical protein